MSENLSEQRPGRYDEPAIPSPSTSKIFKTALVLSVMDNVLDFTVNKLDAPSWAQTTSGTAEVVINFGAFCGFIMAALEYSDDRSKRKEIRERLQYPKLAPDINFAEALNNLRKERESKQPNTRSANITWQAYEGHPYAVADSIISGIELFDDQSPKPYRKFVNQMDHEFTKQTVPGQFDEEQVDKIFELLDRHVPFDSPQDNPYSWRTFYDESMPDGTYTLAPPPSHLWPVPNPE